MNKPKALVPVENMPILFHLFRKYPGKRFVIIGDYKEDVLRKYLNAFAHVKYQVVHALGSGTAAGVKQALGLIPEGAPFLLVWSDLILPDDFRLPEEYGAPGRLPQSDYIGISGTFPCRWRYEGGVFAETPSTEHGVAGFFLFRGKHVLADIPVSGELVRWMQGKKLRFQEISLSGTREFGLLEEYKKLNVWKCRPFNRITIDGDTLTKEPLDAQGRELAKNETAWYEKVIPLGIGIFPQIYSTSPLKMEYVRGRNIYECDLTHAQKKAVLGKLVDALGSLHRAESVSADTFSLREAYYNKTMARLKQIEDLVPFARERYIRVNGRNCRNVFYYRDKLENRVEKLRCDRFHLIHGDCTFSNLMLREDGTPVLIDPRGYFGFTRLYGDIRYDWAKLYYSIVGNYDRFNLKDFSLEIGGASGSRDTALEDSEVKLRISSNGWEDMEDEFFSITGAEPEEIKLLHAIIWLSLTTYAWQDYDSICGAFYNGLWYLEEVL